MFTPQHISFPLFLELFACTVLSPFLLLLDWISRASAIVISVNANGRCLQFCITLHCWCHQCHLLSLQLFGGHLFNSGCFSAISGFAYCGCTNFQLHVLPLQPLVFSRATTISVVAFAIVVIFRGQGRVAGGALLKSLYTI